jgi:hypothetical protein
MSYLDLSIVVYGPGEDPQHRSHWAFAIHKPDAIIGHVLHVSLLNLERLIYQFEIRKGVMVRSISSEGSFSVARLTPGQAGQASNIISEEPAPRDGVERCQDWVLRAVISLEAEEIVPAGTSERIGNLVGQSANNVAGVVGDKWIEATA